MSHSTVSHVARAVEGRAPSRPTDARLRPRGVGFALVAVILACFGSTWVRAQGDPLLLDDPAAAEQLLKSLQGPAYRIAPPSATRSLAPLPQRSLTLVAKETAAKACDAARSARSRGLPEQSAVGSADLAIQFEHDSAVLTERARNQLARLADVLASPSLAASCIELEGHTDGDGTDAYNLSLSSRRAEAVGHELTQAHGIDAARLIMLGKGESEPIADNQSDEGKARNRRVRVRNLGSAP